MQRFWAIGGKLLLERPVRAKRLTELAQELEASGRKIESHFAKVGDSEWNRRVLSHIIGIERWGQRRLRVMQGESLIKDEYNGYRPARDASWAQLQANFQTTRGETIVLAKALSQANVSDAVRVLHNQYGELTARGWLHYLDIHALGESKKMRKG